MSTVPESAPKPQAVPTPIRKPRGHATRCVRDVSAFSAASFRLRTDGRKWKAKAGQRRAIAVELATSADPDGTNITRGYSTLRRVGDYSKKTVERLLKDLEAIGCLKKDRYTDSRGIERERLSKYNTKTRHFDLTPLEQAQAILEETGNFDGHPIDVKERQIPVNERQIRQGTSDSGEGTSSNMSHDRLSNRLSPVDVADLARMQPRHLRALLKATRTALANKPRRIRKPKATAPVEETPTPNT